MKQEVVGRPSIGRLKHRLVVYFLRYLDCRRELLPLQLTKYPVAKNARRTAIPKQWKGLHLSSVSVATIDGAPPRPKNWWLTGLTKMLSCMLLFRVTGADRILPRVKIFLAPRPAIKKGSRRQSQTNSNHQKAL